MSGNAADDPVRHWPWNPGDQGETPVSGYQGAEPFVAKPAPESPASTEQLMEEACDRENSEERGNAFARK